MFFWRTDREVLDAIREDVAKILRRLESMAPIEDKEASKLTKDLKQVVDEIQSDVDAYRDK